jgi:hypothetical protein
LRAIVKNENLISTGEKQYRETDAAKVISSNLAKLDQALPRITQQDIDELAENPVVVRFMMLWDVLSEGMSEMQKRTLLWSTFETIRPSFEFKKRSTGRAS